MGTNRLAILAFGAPCAFAILLLAMQRQTIEVGETLQASSSTEARELGDDVTGVASVIDADTIEIHGERIRLHGVDAPEASQTCRTRSGDSYRCGQEAALRLDQFIGGRAVACEPLSVDRYGRTIATCAVGNQDLGQWLTESGWAVAYTRYSDDYVSAQAIARAERHGMWSGNFTLPEDWRRGIRQ